MTPRQYPAWLRRRRHGAASQGLMDDLAAAMVQGDEVGIRSVLQSSAVLTIDSGGLVPAVRTPTEGHRLVTAGLVSLMAPGTSVEMASINSVPGFVLVRDGRVVAAVTAEQRSGLLSDIWVVCNPDKLGHWNRR